ncbi:PREDICTED: LOW QUALITY PROTEIN: NACHT, LRR and PYD domains-containing protein 1-like [Chinchilla lanigera]|uniref:LOW QUALITY PROTEIN: NACHT, LRR and PYD domains-containing protein 1-like n=1 Tax=Chinchilla lanigera TaxID=34839 RepID=UPI000695C4BE|nr:PREDICTED: LOW QUALITY PROTEIN: NACHT, LRR and PYD domains-containing protein 1-like [Chinchilla lanigera]
MEKLDTRHISEQGQLYRDRFQHVFYFNCRELARHKVMSLAELTGKLPLGKFYLSQSSSSSSWMVWMSQHVLEDPNSGLCQHWSVPLQLPELLGSLLRTTILPASFLITTRTTAVQNFIPPLTQPCWVEILGFSESGRKEYFYKYFTDERQAIRAFNLVCSNSALFTLCLVPWVCRLVCTCLKQQMEQGDECPLTSQATTALCLYYLSQAFPAQPRKMQLRAFCFLAAEGIWRRETMFRTCGLEKHQLGEAITTTFLKMGFLQEHHRSLTCSFTHRHFQEFFAAVSFALGSEDERQEHSNFLNYMVKLLEVYGSHDLFRTPTLHFLFGLLSKQGTKQTEKIFSCRLPSKWKWQLLQWALSKAPTQSPYSLDFFHCLYESRDEELLKLAMARFQGTSMCIQTNVELLEFTCCVKFCSHVKQLQLRDVGHQAQALWCPEEAMLFLVFMTVHMMLALKDLQIGTASGRGLTWVFLKSAEQAWRQRWSPLTNAIWQVFCSILGDTRSLKELDLSGNPLSFFAVQGLCETLREPRCYLEALR